MYGIALRNRRTQGVGRRQRHIHKFDRKKKRGRGHYDESYGSRTIPMYTGRFGTLKSMRKAPVEIRTTQRY